MGELDVLEKTLFVALHRADRVSFSGSRGIAGIQKYERASSKRSPAAAERKQTNEHFFSTKHTKITKWVFRQDEQDFKDWVHTLYYLFSAFFCVLCGFCGSIQLKL